MNTFRRSYAIFRESLTILAKDKEILIFPLLSGIITIVAFASMVFAGFATGAFEHFRDQNNVLRYAVLFIWYFVSWFIVLFFNVAVIACASIRLRGGNPTIADGFRASTQHLGRTVVWALISATVGLILRVVAERIRRRISALSVVVSTPTGVLTITGLSSIRSRCWREVPGIRNRSCRVASLESLEEIPGLNIPTGIPLRYDLDPTTLKPVKSGGVTFSISPCPR